MVGKIRRKFDMLRNNDEMRSESGQDKEISVIRIKGNRDKGRSKPMMMWMNVFRAVYSGR